MHPHRRTVLALAAAAALTAGGALADAPFGPKVGTTAPAIGALADQSGTPRKLADLAGSKGTVVMFFRSAAWCPFCQLQLMDMNAGAAAIEAKGYTIVGISYEPPEVDKAFIDKRMLTYSLLSDPNSVTIDRWGLRDPQYPMGNKAYGVPRPIIFIIDRKGVIRGALAEETFKTRPKISDILATIDAIH